MNFTSFSLLSAPVTVQYALYTNPNITENNCMTNCSNRGMCTFVNGESLLCVCDEFYTGETCSEDTRACSSWPCINNGTCITNATDVTQFTCQCDPMYFGTYCETKINVCQNQTCSGNGHCYDIDNKPVCKCFYLFAGTECEIESEEKKTVKKVMSVASYIAISILVLLALTVILLDLDKIWRCIKRPVIKTRRMQRHKYVNAPGLHKSFQVAESTKGSLVSPTVQRNSSINPI